MISKMRKYILEALSSVRILFLASRKSVLLCPCTRVPTHCVLVLWEKHQSLLDLCSPHSPCHLRENVPPFCQGHRGEASFRFVALPQYS